MTGSSLNGRDDIGSGKPLNAARELRPPVLMNGAPLDAIKLAAAAVMVADHVNSAIITTPELLAWRFGRLAFPLFCFVLACHIARGMRGQAYVGRLLVLGAFTQPIFSAAFPWSPREANVLITLAAGTAIAISLTGRSAWLQHAVLGLGTFVIWQWPLLARTGVDFGLAGMLFPAALTLVICGARTHALWLLALLFALNYGANRPGGGPAVLGAAVDALYAGAGSLAVVGCGALLRGRPRFLPSYALYAFYPGHLLALALWRAWA